MRERIRSPRSSGGLRGICGAASLGASWLWDRRTDRDMAQCPLWAGIRDGTQTQFIIRESAFAESRGLSRIGNYNYCNIRRRFPYH